MKLQRQSKIYSKKKKKKKKKSRPIWICGCGAKDCKETDPAEQVLFIQENRKK